MLIKRRTFMGAGLAAGTLPLLGQVAKAADFKAGYIYVGPVGDFGYSYQHDQGRLAADKALGLTSTFVEKVPEGADAERVIRDLADNGHNIIYTTSFGFMDATLKVARDYPDVKFEHATGYKRSDNMATYNIRFYEGRYIQGVIAGMMSKAGVVGYVGSIPIPEVVMGMNAFILGMRSINPNAKIKQVFINS